MIDRDLQSTVSDDVVDELTSAVTDSLKKIGNRPELKRPAVEEFVSRNLLTHVMIDIWYDQIYQKIQAASTRFLPHVTRRLRASVAARPIREILMPHVLHDILRDTSTARPLSFQNVVMEKRESPGYERLRMLLNELDELSDAKRERTERLLRDEISAITERARPPARQLQATPQSWRLQFPDISRYSSALDSVVVGMQRLDDELFRGFPELKPMSKITNQPTFNLQGANFGGDFVAGNKNTTHILMSGDMQTLVEELERVRAAIPQDSEHESTLDAISEAKAAAQLDGREKATRMVQKLGAGVLEIAKNVGAEIIVAILTKFLTSS
jgi:hypothetical protein